MKINQFYIRAFILSFAAGAIAVCGIVTPARAQTPQTSPSAVKKECKMTVIATSDSIGKDGKYKVRIIQDKDGQITESDTLIPGMGGVVYGHEMRVPREFDREIFNECMPGPQGFAIPNRGESLNDVLGDIPMSRVKSYKVIDKKGGKRIIIDIQDAPLGSDHPNVICIKTPDHPQR